MRATSATLVVLLAKLQERLLDFFVQFSLVLLYGSSEQLVGEIVCYVEKRRAPRESEQQSLVFFCEVLRSGPASFVLSSVGAMRCARG